jgi:hypothetical protein
VFSPVEDLVILPAHMDLPVGLAWVGGLLSDAAVTRSLGVLAVSAYRKVPGIGPRAVRVGNSSINALGMIGDADALGQLALLKVKVKFGGAQIAIDKAMTKLAAKLDVSREDLEEMSVPAYGMTEVGCLTLVHQNFGGELLKFGDALDGGSVRRVGGGWCLQGRESALVCRRNSSLLEESAPPCGTMGFGGREAFHPGQHLGFISEFDRGAGGLALRRNF